MKRYSVMELTSEKKIIWDSYQSDALTLEEVASLLNSIQDDKKIVIINVSDPERVKDSIAQVIAGLECGQ